MEECRREPLVDVAFARLGLLAQSAVRMPGQLRCQVVPFDEVLECVRGDHGHFTPANGQDMGKPPSAVLYRHFAQHLPRPAEGEQPVPAFEISAHHLDDATDQRKDALPGLPLA